MSLRIEILDEALADAEDAARWYARQSQTAATNFSGEFDAAIAQIERAPFSWSPHARNTRRFVFRRFPFSVIYRVEAERILIVAVAHASRHPDYWSDRLKDSD